MNTIRADKRPLDLSLKLSFDALQVGAPRPLALVVGVTDIIADGSFLSTYRTNSSHLAFVSFR